MKIVKVKDIGVQVNGISYFKNSIFEVNDEDYEPIKDFVDVLKEDKTSKQKEINERIVIIEVKDKELDLKEVEKYLYDCLAEFGESTKAEEIDDADNSSVADDKGETFEEDNDDEELEALKDRAKELGINVTHNMRK